MEEIIQFASFPAAVAAPSLCSPAVRRALDAVRGTLCRRRCSRAVVVR